MLSTIGRGDLIEKKKLAIGVFDLDYKAFVVYITALYISPNKEVHPSKKAQIAHLKGDEALTKISIKYVNFKEVSYQNWP